jgi:hypothetical protein
VTVDAAIAAVEQGPLADALAAARLFDAVSLDELGAAALMDRVDRKYMLAAAELPGLLVELADDYRVLEVEGRRLSHYVTRYFDTPGLALYLAHHNDRAPRLKIRVRTYEGANASYLEIKRKTAAGRTCKERILLDEGAPLDPLRERLEAEEGALFDGLAETVRVEYRRLTLVRKDGAERITLDLMLTFRRGAQARAFPNAAIAEVKQNGHGASPFVAAMRARNVRPGGVSKYCAAVANLDPGVKANRFRPALRRLETLGAGALPKVA